MPPMRHECRPERFARRDLVARASTRAPASPPRSRPAGARRVCVAGFGITGSRVGRLHDLRLELGNGFVGLLALLQRLAVPSGLAFDRGEPLPFSVRAAMSAGRPVTCRASSSASRISAMLVAVDRAGPPAEGFEPPDEAVGVVLVLRGTALAESVHVDDRAQVVDALSGGDCAASQTDPSAHSPSPSST